MVEIVGCSGIRHLKALSLASLLAVMALLWASVTLNGQVPGLSLEPQAGIEAVTYFAGNKVEILSSRGICRFRVVLPPAKELTCYFKYSANDPFRKIEGLSVTDFYTGRSLYPDSSASVAVMLRNPDACILFPSHATKTLEVQVIDFYR